MVSSEESPINVCIVCALAEEAKAFLDIVSEQCQAMFALRTSPRYGYDYRFGTIQNNKREKLTLHVSWLPRYGPQEMILHLTHVLEEYPPHFAVMIGICAGDRLRVSLGDLIIAERIYTYDSGKFVIDEHGRRVRDHDVITYQLDENILRFVSLFEQWKPLVKQLKRPPSKRQQREWLLNQLLDEQTPSIRMIPEAKRKRHAPTWRRIVHELQEGPDPLLTTSLTLQERSRIEQMHYGPDPFPYTDPRAARCYVKPMASGNAVRSDNPFKDIQVPVRGTVAIDMEGAAFCRTLANYPEIRWLVVKGVSDYADSDKDDSYHYYASSASARYLLCFLQEYLTQDRIPTLHRRPSPVEESLASIPTTPYGRSLSESTYSSFSRSPIPAKTSHRNISGIPPMTDPRTIQQRERTVKEVYEKLTRPDIAAVELIGIGGIGKSTLAALIYQYAEEQRRIGRGLFAAAPRWVKIDSATTIADLVGTLFESLDEPLLGLEHLAPQNQAAALFNKLNTTDKPYLVVLDQFENLLDPQTGHILADHQGIGEWLDILNSRPCRCRVLLTSRLLPTGTYKYPPTNAQEYLVKGLEVTEGIELLRKQGVGMTQATEGELREAVGRCDGHALALTLLAALIRNQSISLAHLFKDVTLWTGDIASNLLDHIYKKQLSEVQRELLLAFSIYREPVSLDAAQALTTKMPKARIASVLKSLQAQHLLQALGAGRYQLHTIVATYAQSHFDEQDEQANQQALKGAHAKAAEYYLYQARTSCPAREKRRQISDVHQLIEAAWQLDQAGRWQEAYNLMDREGIFSDLRYWGGNAILFDLCQQLLPLEKWNPELIQAALIYNTLASACNALGKKEEARVYYEQALKISREVGDREGEGTVLNKLGWVHDDLGRKGEALEYYEQALGISREVGDRGGEAATLNNLGRLFSALGKKGEARVYYEQALKISREVGDRRREGAILNNLGGVYNALGEKGEALEYYEQALEISREVGDHEGEAVTLNNLGGMYDHWGKKGQAWRYYQQALGIRRAVGDRGGESGTLNNLGHLSVELGNNEEALKYYEQALKISREVGDRRGESMTLNNLGAVYDKLGKKGEALKYYEQALRIEREVKDRTGEGAALNNLGGVYDELGKKEEALKYYMQALRIRKEVGDRGGEGITLHNIGTLCFEQHRYDDALAAFLLAKAIFEEIKSPNRDKTQRRIDVLRKRVGQEGFAALIEDVEPRTHQIVEEMSAAVLRQATSEEEQSNRL